MIGRDAAAKARCFRSLAQLFNAGIGFHEAINLVTKLGEKEDRETSFRVRNRVRLGATFADALRTIEAPRFEIALIHLGETTGTLASACTGLGEYYEQRAAIEKSILRALLKPGIVLTLSILLKRLTPLAAGTITGSQYLRQTAVSLAIFYAAVWGFTTLVRRPENFPKFTAAVMGFARGLPRLKETLRQFELYQFFTGMQVCLKSGCEIGKTFGLVGALTGDPQLKLACVRVPQLSQKLGLTGALEATQVFEPEQISRLHAGEISGTLDASLAEICRDLRARVEISIARFQHWAPRVLYGMAFVYVMLGG